ncbi:lipid-A-disaccharide synthase [Legionella impletisoli]|uniref:Lipid-A-disaccharide synthase n=1 Tax=Legionella impletisoli TaxID=343510 RepID=A0A917JPD4_9GAMM|nr:lipid-A-disaccharide synthase [Legionella impletisoli]GGI76592.1 lipid-A-disaccharide synthase 1 [Legionella impletisoli]
MRLYKHIVFVAGEESGDQHAAEVIRQLKRDDPSLKVTGIGGRNMEAAGAELISDLARFGVTGVTEVLRHFSIIKKAFKAIQKHLRESKPDLLVLVDYPGFNLRLAKFAKRELGLRILYYIGPQIWAWKAGRIHTIQQHIDHMAVILPFEKAIYESAGIPVSFVGHPLVNRMEHHKFLTEPLKSLGLPENKRLLAILPGSRTHEIKKHMPILACAAETLHKNIENLHIVIPVANTIDDYEIERFLQDKSFSYTLVSGHAIDVAAMSECVVVASGTASLECALLGKPMCIIYKASLLTYLLASKLINVKYLGLSNLLQDKMVAPELLQYDFNVHELTRLISKLLLDQTFTERMIKNLVVLKQSLSAQSADCTITDLIKKEVGCI